MGDASLLTERPEPSMGRVSNIHCIPLHINRTFWRLIVEIKPPLILKQSENLSDGPEFNENVSIKCDGFN